MGIIGKCEMIRCSKEGSHVKPDGFVILKINGFFSQLDSRLILGHLFIFG
jgi:hypothetical protein